MARALLLAAALAACPALAQAEETAEESDAEGDAAPALPAETAWLIVEGGLGVTGVTDAGHLAVADMGLYPLAGLSAAAYLRPLRFLSAGVQLTYGLLLPTSDEVDVGAAGFLAVTAFARGQYAFGRLEPWLGLGLGYGQTHAEATGPRARDAGTLTLHAMALDISAGLAIQVAEGLTVGPFARFVFGLWASGCESFPDWPFEVPEDGCDDIEPLYGYELPRLPHLWMVGANVAYWVL